jgi:Patatin-like phospholipase
LGRLLPTALFDNAPLQDYLQLLFNSESHTDDFRKLKARLYVVATSLNTGESVPFGGAHHQDVPISRALLASSALPGLYPAVQIDGDHFVDGARFPTADTLLLEPDRHDERLFFANVFRYAERLGLADHAYRRTRRDLLAQADALAPLLERRGLRLTIGVLRDRNRSLPSATRTTSPRVRQTTRRLKLALARIEHLLQEPGGAG